MKKLLYLIPLLFGMALTSCYNDDIIDINNRLYDLEKDTRVATIQEQIASIQNSLTALEDTDKELSGYITALEAEVEALEAQLAETDTKIDNVKNELSETISTEKANILAELEAFKATVNGELDAIKAVLETLKAKDAELDEQIADLKEYVDSEITATEDWATATFATLEQYNEVVATIATIEGTIEGINESLAALETRINEKIAKDIETACATLSADLQNAVKDITEEYTSAIATTKNELTEAYTAAIKAAIATSEASMKGWVNEQLAGYYTIAEIDAKIAVLETTISEGDEALQKEIDALKTSLAEQKNEITEAYQNAIAEAITTNNGVIDEKIATEIKAVNDKIAGLEERLDQLESRITTLEENFANQQEQLTALVNRIQSVSYIPKYSDGKATIDKDKEIGVFDFQISPKDAVAELEKVWESALSMQAVHTQTRSVSFINLPITYFEADATNGTFSIEVDATNLGDNFFSGEIEASVALCISDGNNNHTSSYIHLALGTVESNVEYYNLSEISTSNCYIVASAGKYAFNGSVMGNGDKGIISNANFHTSSTSITPYEVGLVWDDNNIVSDLYLEDGYVHFTASSNKGNALISVNDSAGNIIWSWHIWATDTPQDYSNYDGYLTMDRNLGAISANYEDGEDTYGLYYQWGRKDPLRNPSTVVDTDETTGNITYTIEHPTQLIGGDFYNWQYSNKSEYLWGYEYDTKTIYDPCPVGYKVSFPVTSRFAYIYDSSRTGGRWDGDLWYPFAGRLHWETGCEDTGVDACGIAGFYYVNTYSNYSKNDTYDQCFSASRVLINNLQYKGFAESIRCIRE